jgi:hypothetical protein
MGSLAEFNPNLYVGNVAALTGLESNRSKRLGTGYSEPGR